MKQPTNLCILQLALMLATPAALLAGSYDIHLDRAIVPSLGYGIALLLIVQLGHQMSNRIWRVFRLKRVLRRRRHRS